jgi:hypothetical protein
MADATRRAVLASAAALPLLAVPTAAVALAAPAADRRAWEQTKAAYLAAEKASEDHYTRVEAPAEARSLPLTMWDRIAEESNRLYLAAGDAELAMMATPAPDLEAVLYKLSRLWDAGRDYRVQSFEVPILADLQRMAEQASRV